MPVLPYGPGKSTSAGTGTVTSVSVVNANGVSATVATPSTTPAITVLLGAITPTSVASTGAVSGTTGTFSGLVTDTGTTLQQIRAETSSDFVASGAVYTIVSGLNATMTAGVVYIGGKRVIAGAIATTTFSATLDSYAYINNAGSISYVSVANGGASPALPANSVWLAKVITGVSAITSIQQYGFDSNGKFIYNTSSSAVSISVYTNTSSAGGTFYYRSQSGLKELWGTTNALSTTAGAATAYSVSLPSSFFSIIVTSTIATTSMTGAAKQYVSTSNTLPLITIPATLDFYAVNADVAAGTQKASLYLRGF